MHEQRKAESRSRRWRGGRWLVVVVGLAAFGLFLVLQEPLADLWQARRRIQELGSSGPEAKRDSDSAPRDRPHPMDPALALARRVLAHVREEVSDYTAVITKRERIGEDLAEEQRFRVKIRHRRERADGTSVPLSVYLRFLDPPSAKGREVIWVEGRNDGKMIAHEGGVLGMVRLQLDPRSLLAMAGHRYPITEIGIERLLEKLVEVGERDQGFDECEVVLDRAAEVGGVPCTRIEVRHPHRRDHFAFHMAEVFVDEARLVPLRYTSWDWPEDPDGPPVLVEDYVYHDLRLHVGLGNVDFDPDNPDYDFP